MATFTRSQKLLVSAGAAALGGSALLVLLAGNIVTVAGAGATGLVGARTAGIGGTRKSLAAEPPPETTTIPFLARVMQNDRFVAGDIDTKFLERESQLLREPT